MGSIKFNCPACNQHIEAPREAFGEEINCPTCDRRILVAKSKQKLKWSRGIFISGVGASLIYLTLLLVSHAIRSAIAEPSSASWLVSSVTAFRIVLLLLLLGAGLLLLRNRLSRRFLGF